jgi:RNA polymerase sigma-70 factor (ECF subfamily)
MMGSECAGSGIISRIIAMPDRFPGDSVFGSVSQVPVLDSEATVSLLDRARGGDDAALNHLLERCVPPLRRWAHGRLPSYARDAQDTADLVQDTVLAALRRLDHLEARREGALQAYLRQALHNRIVDLIRQRRRRPDGTDLPEDLPNDDPSPLDAAIGAENSARYEAALLRLRDEDREAIIGRLELQYSYAELAVALEKPTANAARVAVTRALQRLAQEMPRVSVLP